MGWRSESSRSQIFSIRLHQHIRGNGRNTGAKAGKNPQPRLSIFFLYIYAHHCHIAACSGQAGFHLSTRALARSQQFPRALDDPISIKLAQLSVRNLR